MEIELRSRGRAPILRSSLAVVGVFLFFSSLASGASESRWIRKLRVLGVQGEKVSADGTGWKEAGLNRWVFEVSHLPTELAGESQKGPDGWPHLTPEILTELRSWQEDWGVRLWLAMGSNVHSSRASVTTQPQGYFPQIVNWTPQANEVTLVHERRHILDNRAGLYFKIMEDLQALDFDEKSRPALRKFISELRAFASEPPQFAAARFEDFQYYYYDPTIALLRQLAPAQSFRFAQLVRAYLNDLPPNELFTEKIPRDLEFEGCESGLNSR